MKTFIITLRNVFRNKRRTCITLMAIIFGNIAIITFGGFIEYSFWGMRETTIRSSLGHIQIYKKGYLESGSTDILGYTINNFNEIKNILLNEKQLINEKTGRNYIEIITSQLIFSGIIGSENKSSIASVKGVEQEYDGILSSFDIVEEGYDLSIADPNSGIIGMGLASGLSVKTDSYATLLTSTKYGGLNAMDFKIRGIFRSGIKEYDDITAKIPLKLAQNILGTKDVTKIVILLDETENTEIVYNNLQTLKKKYNWDIELRTWAQLANTYHQVVQLQTRIFNIIKFIIAIIVIFSIANTISMNVMERVREIGTIRSIGGTRFYITWLFLMEGIWIGIIGGLLGIVLGTLLIKIININGILMPPGPGETRGYIAYIHIVPHVLRFSLILSFFTAFISSVFPSAKAARMKIADALRHI